MKQKMTSIDYPACNSRPDYKVGMKAPWCLLSKSSMPDEITRRQSAGLLFFQICFLFFGAGFLINYYADFSIDPTTVADPYFKIGALFLLISTFVVFFAFTFKTESGFWLFVKLAFLFSFLFLLVWLGLLVSYAKSAAWFVLSYCVGFLFCMIVASLAGNFLVS